MVQINTTNILAFAEVPVDHSNNFYSKLVNLEIYVFEMVICGIGQMNEVGVLMEFGTVQDWENYKGEYPLTMRPGFDLYLRPGCSHSMRRFLYRVLEAKEIEILSQKDFTGFTAVDIGANVGYWSAFLAQKIGQGELHAFEPDPISAKILYKNLKQISVKFHVIEKALSNRKGMRTLYSDPSQSGLNSLDKLFDAQGINVECTTLDDYVGEAGLERVDFIKIDVQGEEVSVLEGAISVISRHLPCVYMEWTHEFQFEDTSAPYPYNHEFRTSKMLQLTEILGLPYSFDSQRLRQLSAQEVFEFSGNLLFNPPTKW